ncbi:SCFD2 protein, partial [Psilopogon haemacephalus]|nr:SCFD2 protein [Psilopogon haemacephalus]
GCASSQSLTPEAALGAVDDVFRSLRDVARARSHLKQFSSIHDPGSNTHQASAAFCSLLQHAASTDLTPCASYKPLLKQVVEEICSPERPDPLDIEHLSAGLSDLLKTGFSMFMKVNRPHPGDHPLLILFVLGGVTVSEVKMVKELVASRKPGTQVLLLSSALLTPGRAVELLFATHGLQPDAEI